MIDFSGRVTSIKSVSRSEATVTVSSWLVSSANVNYAAGPVPGRLPEHRLRRRLPVEQGRLRRDRRGDPGFRPGHR